MQEYPTGPYAALKIKDYRNFISARFCITLAIQIQTVVAAMQIYKITPGDEKHKAWLLGLIGLTEAIPSICVSLYAGHIADIMNRKKIILTCVSTLLFCSSSLWF